MSASSVGCVENLEDCDHVFQLLIFNLRQANTVFWVATAKKLAICANKTRRNRFGAILVPTRVTYATRECFSFIPFHFFLSDSKVQGMVESLIVQYVRFFAMSFPSWRNFDRCGVCPVAPRLDLCHG